jgi:DNA-binding Lrp family transcriptional regulator
MSCGKFCLEAVLPTILRRRGAAVAPRSWIVRIDARKGSNVTDIDATDVQILELLAVDGRMPNSALAARVGIAPSTCLGRVRALRERGILRGFAADIDPAALGYPIQAMISIRMQPHARDQLTAFMDGLLEMPVVLNAFLLGGNSDFLIHVAASSVERLRELVIDQLNTNPAVAASETNLIFQYRRARRIPISVS